ncbi:phagosome assembly factor 1-like [Styela clava]
MLDLNVLPERSLGNEQWSFALGMPLSQIVQILQTHCRVIKSVEVIYQEKRPIESDLVLNLNSDGIKLVFDSTAQRLKVIEVFNMSKVKLKYCGNYFNSPQNKPTPEQIEQAFGATRPGQYDASLQSYIVSFRGLTFFFPVDAQFENFFAKHSLSSATSSLPTDFIPAVSRMCIYAGSQLNETTAPAMPLSCYHGNLYLDSAEVSFKENGKECDGLDLKLITVPDNKNETIILEKSVKFGDSVQQVLAILGSPCKIFYKLQDKMKIHSASPRKLNETRHTDYFYNYFTLGIDILFDGKFHQVKKFLLHTNFPGHYNFNIYYRCDFKIKLLGEENCVDVTPCTLWNDVIGQLPFDVGKPVVLNRASSTNNTNPFGSNFCFGLRNMIFEVMSNNHIASVTLYNPQKQLK